MGKGTGRGGSATIVKDDSTIQQQSKLMVIDGREYDISKFIKKHPGGSVIKFYLEQDASEAFHEFHSRSPKAMRYLKNLPSKQLNEQKGVRDPLVADFIKLRQDLEDKGFFKTSPMHVVYRVVELFLIHALGLFLLSCNYYWSGLVMLGIGSGRCGWLMHEGGHYSLTGNIHLDRHIQMFFYGFGCGMSGAYWRNQHNKHHATPQKIGNDVDLETMPLVAFSSLAAQRGKKPSALHRLWIRLQAYLFSPIICLLVTLGWQFYLHPRHALRIGNVIELAWMGLRYIVIAALFGHAGWGCVVGYLIYNWVGGCYIFTNFAVSHTHLPVLKEDENTDWVRYSAHHTMNCENSWWCNWWMSYLNFQIEHHLFPSMPQFRHPQVSPMVKALFEKHGIKYDQRGYFEAMWHTFKNLDQVGADVFYG